MIITSYLSYLQNISRLLWVSRYERIISVTGLDIYIENGYKLPDGFENTLFHNDSL